MKGIICYTEDKQFFVPEVKIKKQNPAYTYEATRGFGHTLIVLENDKCIGWCVCELLGFNSAREFLKAKGEI